MNRRKRFREIRFYENLRNPSRGKFPPAYSALLNNCQQVSFLFAGKLRELDFRVEKFPVIYILLDTDLSEDEPPKVFPDYLIKEVLEIVVGFPKSFLDSPDQMTKNIATFISRQMTAFTSRIGASDDKLIEKTKNLLLEHGLDLAVVLLEKNSRRYHIKVFFKCIRKRFDPERSCVIFDEGQDYELRAAVYLDSVDKETGARQSRFLFDTSPLVVYLMFDNAIIKGDQIEFVSKSTKLARSYLRNESYPTIVPIFENQEKQPGVNDSRLLQS